MNETDAVVVSWWSGSKGSQNQIDEQMRLFKGMMLHYGFISEERRIDSVIDLIFCYHFDALIYLNLVFTIIPVTDRTDLSKP